MVSRREFLRGIFVRTDRDEKDGFPSESRPFARRSSAFELAVAALRSARRKRLDDGAIGLLRRSRVDRLAGPDGRE